MEFPLVRVTGKSGRFAPSWIFPSAVFPATSFVGLEHYSREDSNTFASSVTMMTKREASPKHTLARTRKGPAGRQPPLFLIASRLNRTCLASRRAGAISDAIPPRNWARGPYLSTRRIAPRWPVRGSQPSLLLSRACYKHVIVNMRARLYDSCVRSLVLSLSGDGSPSQRDRNSSRCRDTLRSGCSPERFLFTLTRKRAPRSSCTLCRCRGNAI